MNIYETYREAEVLTADSIRLTELLYRGAVEAVRQARALLHTGEIEARGRAISRASEILLELTASLDFARGGELSRRLAELYMYMTGRLTEAHSGQLEEPLAEVEKLLVTLLEGWSGIRTREPEVPVELYGSVDVEREPVSCAF